VLHGDTAVVQYGIGTFGSRNTAVGGAALYYALQEIKTKMTRYGEMLLDSEDVTFGNGHCVCNKSGKSVTVAEIAGAAYRAIKLPKNVDPGLVATRFWEPPNFAYPFGAHLAVTEIDKTTGEISILRYIACDDCGNIINPLLVNGQVHGGIVQGIGQALYEHAVYDESGNLLTGELMDYAIPRARMIPWLETSHTITPSPVNPLGVKGVGEAGTIGCSPALVNSVVDALRPLGVKHVDMPMTPQRIWNLIQAAEVHA
jgi:carbon-monoxide dehydrogenase large subunit